MAAEWFVAEFVNLETPRLLQRGSRRDAHRFLTGLEAGVRDGNRDMLSATVDPLQVYEGTSRIQRIVIARNLPKN